MAQQLTTDILNAALENLTSKRHQIDEQIGGIRRVLSGRNGTADTAEPATRKRTMSAAGRRAIASAQRRRWAERKATGGSPAAKAGKPKRKLSAAGRAAIVAALRRRWAARKAAVAKPVATSSKTAHRKAA